MAFFKSLIVLLILTYHSLPSSDVTYYSMYRVRKKLQCHFTPFSLCAIFGIYFTCRNGISPKGVLTKHGPLEGNGNLTQVILHGEPHGQYEKAKKIWHWKIINPPPPRSVGVYYTAGEEWRVITNSSSKNKWLGQSRNDCQLWTCLAVKVKSDAVNHNIV